MRYAYGGNYVVLRAYTNGRVALAANAVMRVYLPDGVTVAPLLTLVATGADVVDGRIALDELGRWPTFLGPEGVASLRVREEGSTSDVVTLDPLPGGAGSEHGDLAGLGDDDHPLYLTAARGDARYEADGALDAATAYTDARLATIPVDAASGTPSLRTLGTGGQQAASGAGLADETAARANADAALTALVNALNGAIVEVAADVDAEAGTRADADAAEAAARTAHENDTTNVHGIADTGALVLTTDPRLADQRVPPDGSVTLAKLAFDPATQAELDAEATARADADNAEAAARAAADAARPTSAALAAAGGAALVGFSPSGNIVAGNVQAAIVEVAAEAGQDLRRQFRSVAQGAVCFTWDDGFADHVNVAQLAADRGQAHTFAVTTALLNGATYMTNAQVAQVAAMGHEIASHAVNHTPMTGLSVADRVAQYENSKATLEGLVGAGKVTSFFYPHGSRSTATDRELFLRYDRIFGISASQSRIPVQDRAGRYLLGRTDWSGAAAQHQWVLAAIRQAATSPVVVVIYSHRPDSVGSATTAQIVEALNLAQSLGVPCVTTDQAFPGAPLLLDGGFESAVLGGWIERYENAAGEGTFESVVDAPAAGLQGTRSLRLANSNATGFAYLAQPIPALPNTHYTLSGLARVSAVRVGVGVTQFRVTEFTAHGTQLAQTTTTIPGTQTVWGNVSHAFTTNAQTAYVRVDVLINQLSTEMWVDHMDLRPTRLGVFGTSG